MNASTIYQNKVSLNKHVENKVKYGSADEDVVTRGGRELIPTFPPEVLAVYSLIWCSQDLYRS